MNKYIFDRVREHFPKCPIEYAQSTADRLESTGTEEPNYNSIYSMLHAVVRHNETRYDDIVNLFGREQSRRIVYKHAASILEDYR